MGLALAYKRGEVEDSKVSDTVRDLAKSMSEKELEDFAKTKHKGLPDKVDEGYDPKHVKMAIGVASDKRYKQGNYSGAVRAIEKIKKGLSKHPQVAAVLKRQNEAKDPGEYDQEGDMAKTQLKTIMRNASDLADLLDDNENMPEWVQNKITKASDYITSAYNYMASEDNDEEEVKEYLEVGTDKIRKSYASMTPGQTNELTGTDKAIALGAVGALGYAAKKAKDRFDPVKVRDARKKRMEREAEKRQAQQDIARMKREREQKRAAKDRLARMKSR
jgi:hypothetical protein